MCVYIYVSVLEKYSNKRGRMTRVYHWENIIKYEKIVAVFPYFNYMFACVCLRESVCDAYV